METRERIIDPAALIACHDCDLLHRRRRLDPGEVARCVRCGARLYQSKKNSLDRTLALSVASLILFVLANVYPFLTFGFEGRFQSSTILSGTLAFYDDGMLLLAAIMFFVSFLAPLVKIAGLFWSLALLRSGRGPRRSIVTWFRLIETIRPWGMLEILLLGGLVALVKLSDMATIHIGIAFWSFCALIIVSTWANSILDPTLVWDRLGQRR